MASFTDNLQFHLECDLRSASFDVEDNLTRLAEECENLARSLIRAAEQCRGEIENGEKQASINSCGEVQGRGPSIDRLCGELRLRREYLARLRSLENVTE
jgi:hypothetical protein